MRSTFLMGGGGVASSDSSSEIIMEQIPKRFVV